MGYRIRGKDNRWKGKCIAYSVAPDVGKAARASISKAIEYIEKRTHLRFGAAFTSTTDCLAFEKSDRNWSELGRKRGEQRIELTNKASRDNVIHEIFHALGMAHEHQRPDRDKYITVIEDNIDSWLTRARDFNKKGKSFGNTYGPYDYRSRMHYKATAHGKKDAKGNKKTTIRPKKAGVTLGGSPTSLDLDCANGIVNGHFHCHPIEGGGGLDARIDTLQWKHDDYDKLRFFTTGEPGAPNQRVFSLVYRKRSRSGRVYVREVTGETGRGVLGPIRASYSWDGYFDSIEFYRSGNSTYMLRHREPEGYFLINRISSRGEVVTPRVQKKNWTSGYTQVRPFEVGGAPRLWIQKSGGDGRAAVHSIGPDGHLGGLLAEYHWSRGWTMAEFCAFANATYVLIYKRGTGRVEILRIKADGGYEIISKDTWSKGWSHARFFRTPNGQANLLTYKQGSGRIHLNRFLSNGELGARTYTGNWQSNWASFDITPPIQVLRPRKKMTTMPLLAMVRPDN